MSSLKNQIQELITDKENECNKLIGEIKSNIKNVNDKFIEYNSVISNINSQKGEQFIYELRKLYKFLIIFGNLPKSVPNDLSAEKTISIIPMDIPEDKISIENKKVKGYFDNVNIGWIKKVGQKWAELDNDLTFKNSLSFLNGPLYNRKLYKEKLEYLTTEYNNRINQLVHIKGITNGQIEILKTMITIAELLNVTLLGLRTCVQETIIPEFEGIYAFVHAYVAVNTVIDGDDIEKLQEYTNVQAKHISEMSNTAFKSHYLFIKNTFDYYNILFKIFNNSILNDLLKEVDNMDQNLSNDNLKILTDHAISRKTKLEEYKNDLEQTENKIKSNLIFGGD